MVDFITMVIKRATYEGLEAGQVKYKSYFKNSYYKRKYQAEVDQNLIADGYDEVIVSM